MPELTQARLKEVLDYDPETGVFTWLRRVEGPSQWNGKWAGKRAGHSLVGKSQTYLRISVDRREYLAHRLAFLYLDGSFPPEFVDHLNGNGLDNRWVNLRLADVKLNSKSLGLRKDSTTKVCGVHFSIARNKFKVSVKHQGKLRYGGSFITLEEAAVRARQLYAEFGYAPHHGLTRDERAKFSAKDLPNA